MCESLRADEPSRPHTKCLEVQSIMGDKAKGKGKQLKKPKQPAKDKKASSSK
jgi:hypothetical protein